MGLDSISNVNINKIVTHVGSQKKSVKSRETFSNKQTTQHLSGNFCYQCGSTSPRSNDYKLKNTTWTFGHVFVKAVNQHFFGKPRVINKRQNHVQYTADFLSETCEIYDVGCINSLHSISILDRIIIPITVNGKLCQMEFNTGAAVSVISKRFWKIKVAIQAT